MNRPVLFMMHGIYGSGKSTFARQLAGELSAEWLRSDEIRAALEQERQTPLTQQEDEELVFGTMDASALQALSAGQSVIYDGHRDIPNSHRHTRAATADKLLVPAVVIWMQTPLAKCVWRAANRQHDEHAVIISEARVRTHYEELAHPAPDEQCIAIDGMATFNVQHRQFADQFEKILGYN